MSKLQRRLILASIAVVLLLGPIVLMGNCSGWNEGSMQVASCTVDFPLAWSLANLLYGVLLLSAFMLGLPILAYVLVCVFALLRLRRTLRDKAPATGAVAPSWRELSPGRRALLIATTSLGAAVLLGLSLQLGAAAISWRAKGDDFAMRCRSAGEQFLSAPADPVTGVYYEGDVTLADFKVQDGQYQSGESDYGLELNDLLGRGWLGFTETPERDATTGNASGRIMRRSVQVPFDGQPVEIVSGSYGIYSVSLTDAGDRSGIEGTELEIRDRSTGSVIAKLRYFIRPVQSAFCGPVHDGRFSVGDFLVRALKLTRQAPQAPAADLKPVKGLAAGNGRVLQNGSDTFQATALGETRDSWILIDKVNVQRQGDSRFATDAESLKVGSNAVVKSTRSSREYDCGQRRYRVRTTWTWSGVLNTGDVLRPLEPADGWVVPAPGTVGDLLVNTVCSIG